MTRYPTFMEIPNRLDIQERLDQQRTILVTGENVMRVLFGNEPGVSKAGTKKSEARKYWEIFRKLMNAEPRYFNYVEQFIAIFQQANEWQGTNEKLFLHAFEKALSATRKSIEKELQDSLGLAKLTLEEREDLLSRFLKSPTVQQTLARTHQKIVIHRSRKEYAKEVLLRLETAKEGLKDPLTGMLNKKALLQVEGPREIGRSIRQIVSEMKNLKNLEIGTEQFYTSLEQKGCSFIMIDIDFFKNINDTYGHPVGDEILKQVAKTIDSIRESDIVTRYGGEEFCVILPDTSPIEALQVAERMREKIEHTSYKCGKSSKPISLSVSMGVIGLSQLPSWKSSLSYLLQTEPYDDEANRERLRIYEEHLVEEGIVEADKALYVAKRTGRNKAEMWNRNTDILFQGLKQKEE